MCQMRSAPVRSWRLRVRRFMLLRYNPEGLLRLLLKREVLPCLRGLRGRGQLYRMRR